MLKWRGLKPFYFFMSDTSNLRTWIEVDTSAIAHNVSVFRSLIPANTKLGGVVKSNAYGHDFIQFAQELIKLGVEWLLVDSMVEAIALRREGITTPILVLGYTLPDMMNAALENDIQLSISSFENIEAAIAIAKVQSKSLNIHIKIDTGMNRQGFVEAQREQLITLLKENKEYLNIVGVLTHFAAAKNPALPNDTHKQIERFNPWREAFINAGFKPLFHAAATGGALLYPEAHLDLVRVGIGLYGLWPSTEARQYLKGQVELKPALSWKTIIGEIKSVPKCERVGYDFTESLRRPNTISNLPSWLLARVFQKAIGYR
jgi:alanine racemase